jgi:putative aminopeptidase FrvX
MVKYIDPNGFVYLDSLGGNDYGAVLCEHLVIHTKDGPVQGVVGRKPLHLQQGDEVQKIPPASKIWLDIGAKDGAEARRVVSLGDYVTFELRVTELRNDLISAPALDNKAGLLVCLEALRRCAKRGCPPDVALYVVSTVQEEIGSRGAATATSKLSPDVGVAVDTAPTTDDPGYDLPPQRYVPCKLGGGPMVSTGPNTNVVVEHLMVEGATRHKIPFQPDPSGKTAANDARMIQISDSGVASASIGIPLRNMHTQVEICSLNDLQHSVDLLVEFVQAIRADTDLRPINFSRHRSSRVT